MKTSRKVQIGDILIVAVAKENREWGYSPAPDGTRVIVTEFNTRYRGRVNEFGRKPGKYSFNDNPITAREDNGEVISVGGYHLKFEDGYSISMDIDGEWVGELPELPFWEGDTVTTGRDMFGRDTNEVIVTRIAYDDIHTKCTDGVTPYPIYTISPSMTAGVTTAARESDLTLVRRGDVWKYYHGEPMHFDSVVDEAKFYDGQLGRTKDVRNETIGLFSWTIEEAVNAVREGKGDAISVTPRLFGSKQRPYVKQFIDREIGERVRTETLKGWADFDAAKFADEIAEELQHREEMNNLFKRGTYAEASH